MGADAGSAESARAQHRSKILQNGRQTDPTSHPIGWRIASEGWADTEVGGIRHRDLSPGPAKLPHKDLVPTHWPKSTNQPRGVAPSGSSSSTRITKGSGGGDGFGDTPSPTVLRCVVGVAVTLFVGWVVFLVTNSEVLEVMDFSYLAAKIIGVAGVPAAALVILTRKAMPAARGPLSVPATAVAKKQAEKSSPPPIGASLPQQPQGQDSLKPTGQYWRMPNDDNSASDPESGREGSGYESAEDHGMVAGRVLV